MDERSEGESSSLDETAFRFFQLFAQFEYALKALGYGRAGNADAAEADWDRFANEVGQALLREEMLEIVEARNYLFDLPPKRQVWIGGAVYWRIVPNTERSPQILFAHIRRVRNNLYHGGKFNGRWIEPDRSEELVTKALLLLQHAGRIDTKLREVLSGNSL